MIEPKLAPIALFVYNRPHHTRKTVEALQRNEPSMESDLIIFSDAPKSSAQAEAVREVRQYIRQVNGFRSVAIVERETNFGLARSVIDGVTSVVNKYGCIIVIEDDLVTSPYFLQYMNDALTRYQNEERVSSIGGYMYPLAAEVLPEQFFLGISDCWGWATWQRAWKVFNCDGKKLVSEIESKGLESRFNLDGAYDYMGMLRGQVEGKNDSWAVRWYATNLLLGRLTLYPGRSMTANIGNDSSGTHLGADRFFEVMPADAPLKLKDIIVAEHLQARRAISAYLKKQQPTLFRKLRGAVTRVLNR